jgi:hypothetical protein
MAQSILIDSRDRTVIDQLRQYVRRLGLTEHRLHRFRDTPDGGSAAGASGAVRAVCEHVFAWISRSLKQVVRGSSALGAGLCHA